MRSVIDNDQEMSMETETDSTLTNSISQHPRVDTSSGIGVTEPSVSNTGLANSCAPSSITQVAGEDELWSRELPQDVAHTQLHVYCRAYVDGFVQGVDATLTIDMGAANSIVPLRLFRKISKDHHLQLAKTPPVNDAWDEPLKMYGKAVVEICMSPSCLEYECVVSDIVDKLLLGEDLMCVTPQALLTLTGLKKGWYSMMFPSPEIG